MKVSDENKIYYIYMGTIFVLSLVMVIFTSHVDHLRFGSHRIVVKHNILAKYAILYALLLSTSLVSLLFYFFRGKAIVAVAMWKISFFGFAIVIYFNLGLLNNFYDKSVGKEFETRLMVPVRTIYSKEAIRRDSCVEIENPEEENVSYSQLYYCYRRPWENWPGGKIFPYALPGTKVRITVNEGFLGAKWISKVQFD